MPKSRKGLLLAVTLGVLLAVLMGSVLILKSPSAEARSLEGTAQAQLAQTHKLKKDITHLRKTTWRLQDRAELPRTESSFAERKVKGIGYLRWLSKLWANRAKDARVHARTFQSIVRKADRSLVQNGHSGSPLRQELRGIVKASREEGISPYFILAIAGKESTFGLATCGKNAWGWNRCSSNGWKTFTEGAKTVAQGLRTKYLGQWGSDTIYEVGYDYCGSGCGSSWSSGVSYFLSSIFDAGSGMRWKDAVRSTVK